MLYSINQIQGKLARNPEYREKKADIMLFFHANNIFNNLGVKKIYTSDNHPPLLVEKNDIEKICQLASEKFGLTFDYNSLYNGEKPLLTLDENTVGIKSYQVQNIEDVNLVIEEHYRASSYGLKQQTQEAAKEIKKASAAEELALYIQKKKKEEWEAFNKASNLKRDFDYPKIVSIDFEFFLNKNTQTHTVTELGITVQENQQIKSNHYLVEETYQLKKNRRLQNKFHFGETKIVKLDQLNPLINNALEDAQYVLFHEQREDFEILQSLDVDLKADVLDTQLSYKHYFKQKSELANGKPLEDLLDFCKVEYKDLHNAGNDSYYTLVLLKVMQTKLLKKEEMKLSSQPKKNKM